MEQRGILAGSSSWLASLFVSRFPGILPVPCPKVPRDRLLGKRRKMPTCFLIIGIQRPASAAGDSRVRRGSCQAPWFLVNLS